MTKLEEANEVLADLRLEALENLREKYWKKFWRIYFYVCLAITCLFLVINFSGVSVFGSISILLPILIITSITELYQKTLKKLIFSLKVFPEEKISMEMKNVFLETSQKANQEINQALKLIEKNRRFIQYQKVWGEDF